MITYNRTIPKVAIQADTNCRQFTFCVDGLRTAEDPVLSCGVGTRFNRDTGIIYLWFY